MSKKNDGAGLNSRLIRRPIQRTTAKTSMSGARTAIRMIIMNAFWTLVTSVVRRVTSDEVDMASILAKLKFLTLA